MISKKTGYAILALACLKDETDQWVLSKEIAKCTGIPRPFLSQILHSLGKEGLIETKSGYRGGVRLSRPPDQISVLDVIETIEGADWLPDCLLGLEDCVDLKDCPTHEFWEIEKLKITNELNRLNIAEIANFTKTNYLNEKGLCAIGEGI